MQLSNPLPKEADFLFIYKQDLQDLLRVKYALKIDFYLI